MLKVKDNIKVMLDSVKAEREQMQRRLEMLVARETTLLAWLAEEQPSQTALPTAENTNGSTPLSGFLQSALRDGKPHHLHELGERAFKRGLIGDGKSPGRVVHFALIGLQQHNLVHRTKDGEWTAKK